MEGEVAAIRYHIPGVCTAQDDAREEMEREEEFVGLEDFPEHQGDIRRKVDPGRDLFNLSPCNLSRMRCSCWGCKIGGERVESRYQEISDSKVLGGERHVRGKKVYDVRCIHSRQTVNFVQFRGVTSRDFHACLGALKDRFNYHQKISSGKKL